MATDTSCVFCEIAAGSAAADVVCEDRLALAILDIQPLARGHCLVIPRRHVPWWHEMSEDETASLFGVARVAAQKLMKVMEPDFVAMYARGRRIPHTHLFLVPTFAADPVDRFFNALEGFQECADRLARLRDGADRAAVARLLRDA
jgi:histidine triad (HIT) family protein